MPWQRQVANIIGEESKPGMPAYREVGVTVPRQSGKTVLQFSVALDRCLNWPTPQRVAYTAQSGWDARRKMVDDIAPIVQRGQLGKYVDRVNRGAGNESILFKNGSRIDVMASNEAAGHGRTLDLAIIDEAWADSDFRREQAALPAMVTRAAAQVLVFSTAGTEASVFLKRKVEVGRLAAEESADRGIAYFEWSADEDDDPDSEDVWLSCMPALGHTIRVDAIRHARNTMIDGDFRRAYLNQWMTADERIIPGSAWADVSSPSVAVAGRACIAVEVSPAREWACIAAADDRGFAEVVQHESGVGWLTDKVKALVADQDVEIVVDRRGPASRFIEEWKAERLPVVEVDTHAYTNACQAFLDNVMDRRVNIRQYEGLDKAVAAAQRRSVGDSWVWRRHDGIPDSSPLVAVTLALGHAFKVRAGTEIGVMSV